VLVVAAKEPLKRSFMGCQPTIMAEIDTSSVVACQRMLLPNALNVDGNKLKKVFEGGRG